MLFCLPASHWPFSFGLFLAGTALPFCRAAWVGPACSSKAIRRNGGRGIGMRTEAQLYKVCQTVGANRRGGVDSRVSLCSFFICLPPPPCRSVTLRLASSAVGLHVPPLVPVRPFIHPSICGVGRLSARSHPAFSSPLAPLIFTVFGPSLSPFLFHK